MDKQLQMMSDEFLRPCGGTQPTTSSLAKLAVVMFNALMVFDMVVQQSEKMC